MQSASEYVVDCRNVRALKFALWMSIAALAIFLIPFSQHGFRIDAFITAGDKFVDQQAVPVRIGVLKNSNGYDGQFYFRLAMAPDARTKTDLGVTLDNPAWRMQRIGYPVFVHMLALGHAQLVPFMLVFANFLGLFALAFASKRLECDLHLPGWFAIAAMAWPGYAVTLALDTTEILSVALMAGAIGAFVARRHGLYALLVVCATLTRETPVLVFAGLCAMCWLDLVIGWIRTRNLPWDKLVRFLLAGVALVPFLLWRQFLAWRWGVGPGATASTAIGWPLVGIYRKLAECIAGTHGFSPHPLSNDLDRALVFATLVAFVALLAWGIVRLPRLWTRDVAVRGLALGWLVLGTLHACLTSLNNGPWVDMTGYLRGCSEFWYVSMLVLALSGVALSRRFAVAGLAFYALVVLKNLL